MGTVIISILRTRHLKRREVKKRFQSNECCEEVRGMDSKPGHRLQECDAEQDHYPGYPHSKFSVMHGPSDAWSGQPCDCHKGTERSLPECGMTSSNICLDPGSMFSTLYMEGGGAGENSGIYL